MTLDHELKKRKSHFQWIVNSLRRNKQDFYLEKDWYDTPTLVSLSDAEKEVGQIDLLQHSRVRRIWQSMRRLFLR